MSRPAILTLADGTVFRGVSVGADGQSVGEVVFNTAMTGYQEILTDPSYCRQQVTLTYPHIGNTGVNEQDNESQRIFASGLIIRDLPLLASNYRASGTLAEFLVSDEYLDKARLGPLVAALRALGVEDIHVLPFATLNDPTLLSRLVAAPTRHGHFSEHPRPSCVR